MYHAKEQLTGFDRVPVRENQVPSLIKEADTYYLQILAPEAKSVVFRINEKDYICAKNGGGVWRMEYAAEKAFQYVQLIIDEVELLTPLLPIACGYSRPYNYVALDEAEEDFYEIRNVPHGSVRREYFYSEITGGWESCMVYTPYCYEAEKRDFPVLYLQHGHGENETSWTACGKLNFILDNLIAEKKAVPMIVVMCNGMVQVSDEKGNPLVDFHLLERQLFMDVIPWAEEKFRIGKKREMRAMAGLSMGSLQTSMTGFLHPGYFSALGIFSGFVTDRITGGPLDMVQREKGLNRHLDILDDAKKFAELFPVYFRAMGDADPYMEWFKQDDRLLEEKGIEHIRRIYPGAHDWNVWRMCIRDFLTMIFQEEKN